MPKPGLSNQHIGIVPATVSGHVKHVVIIVQENRSFDQYFGLLPNVRGFRDPSPLFKQAWPRIQQYKDGLPLPELPPLPSFLYPFPMDVRLDMGSVNHGWDDQHIAWNEGALDQWLAIRSLGEGDTNPNAMGYYTPQSIPYQTALANSFTLCDNYFSSVLASTASNRLMLFSGTIDPTGKHGGPATGDPGGLPRGKDAKGNDVVVYGWKSYLDQLDAATPRVSCAVYEQDPSDRPGEHSKWTMNLAAYFTGWSAMKSRVSKTGAADFEDDVALGALPTVSWLIPPYSMSEHPHFSPLAGANWVAQKLNALWRANYWKDTAVILTYDENGGCFDHVAPPVPAPGEPGEWLTKGENKSAGPGFRVPCIVISPWTVGGRISSQPFDHTSVLQFLESVTGVRAENVSAYRRRTFGNLAEVFDFTSAAPQPPVLPSTSAPPAFPGLVPLPAFPQQPFPLPSEPERDPHTPPGIAKK
jgi:phospholipase C